jgi:hypothetical protein
MPVNIQGRQYVTVAERLEVAHGAKARPVGIVSISTQFEVSGEFMLCRAQIAFGDGRTFAGTAEVSRGLGRGAQAAAPVETAETSAIGRALAAAGYFGSDGTFAGAEEVLIAQARGVPAPAPVRNGSGGARLVGRG